MSSNVGQHEDRPARRGPRAGARTLAEAAWFPAVLFLGFLTCFAPALHAPEPHHAPVVVAGADAAREVDALLEKSRPGAYDVTAVPDAAHARQAVRDRTAVAGFVSGERAVLFVAKANGASLEQALTTTFTDVTAERSQHLSVDDVAPTVAADRMGTTVVYFAIAWSVPGYILATTLLRAVTFDRRRRFLAILAVSAVFALVGYGVGVGLGYLPHDPATLPVAFLLTTAVATSASGIAPFTRQFFPAVGMTLFIVLSIPTSGGVAPPVMLPPFFQYVHAVMPLGNAVDALRSALYFDGAGLLRPLLVLCAWIAAGGALLGLDARLHRLRPLREAEGDVPEPPVDDPAVESPVPTPLPVHPHHFGEPAPDLVGTVLDAGGRPVRYATAAVLSPGGRHLVSTSTDAHGAYAVTGLPEGWLDILVTAPGQEPVALRHRLRAGEVIRADATMTTRAPTPTEPTA
ncbi:carboxypeptidase regulatory-like domain-containing protein [Streptomyces sp. NPDC090106]|uniref:carboxypeptidase regulatory-like domain-containing protein n=1 Tax=Streptomyces sp. NPDC090106 TaxID=3365946 RepID=UPI00380E22B0